MKKLLLISFYISSCCSSQKTPVATEDYWIQNNYVKAEIFYPEGMAGCSYLLKTETQNLQPLNLHDSLNHDGTKVWVKYHLEKERMSVCMMGPVVTIDDIQLRK